MKESLDRTIPFYCAIINLVMFMYNILFICYGNICRSPMALMIFKDLVYKNNKKYMFNVSSRATSVEELGNGIYYEALNVLEKNNVTIEDHKAIQVTKEDYEKYDYIKPVCIHTKHSRISVIAYRNQNQPGHYCCKFGTPKIVVTFANELIFNQSKYEHRKKQQFVMLPD